MSETPPSPLAEDHLPGRWELEIRQAWRDAVRPEPPLQDPKWAQLEPAWANFEVLDAEQWLSGKTWEEIASEEESWHMELEFPFRFFRPAASAYYLGGYLLEIAIALEQEHHASFAENHFTHFCNSKEFGAMLPYLNPEQSTLLRRFIHMMLSHRDFYRISDDTARMLSSSASQIVST